MPGGRPLASGPVILQPPLGGYRVRLSEGIVKGQLGWGLAPEAGDIEFWCLTPQPGELWCAPASLRGPSGKHPMERYAALAQDTDDIPRAVVDDLSELPSAARVLVATRFDTFQAAWAQTKAQNQLMLKLNKKLGLDLGWEPQRVGKDAASPKARPRKIALLPVGGILMLLSHDRYTEARSEPFDQWLEDRV